MRSYHRKTLIRKEHWPQIDDWYWCPLGVIEERIDKEHYRLKSIAKNSAVWYSYGSWMRQQYKLEAQQ